MMGEHEAGNHAIPQDIALSRDLIDKLEIIAQEVLKTGAGLGAVFGAMEDAISLYAFSLIINPTPEVKTQGLEPPGCPASVACACRGDEAELARRLDGAQRELAAERKILAQWAEHFDMRSGATLMLSQSARDVLAERRRQVEAENFSLEHDDLHNNRALTAAAVCYAIGDIGIYGAFPAIEKLWPWKAEWWKPSTPRRNLVKAGALIFAEIERLDRVEARDVVFQAKEGM